MAFNKRRRVKKKKRPQQFNAKIIKNISLKLLFYQHLAPQLLTFGQEEAPLLHLVEQQSIPIDTNKIIEITMRSFNPTNPETYLKLFKFLIGEVKASNKKTLKATKLKIPLKNIEMTTHNIRALK